MLPRFTIVALLVVGTFMSGTGGVGLAYQGFGQSGDNAAAAQYGTPPGPVTVPGQPDRSDVKGGPPMLGPETGTAPGMGQAERLDVAVGGPPPPELQVARQVEAGSSLPFTGFAAIPLLVLGMILVVTGLVFRRRASGEDPG
jgi:hypothetical protein